MKEIIYLIDKGNANFLIEKDEKKYNLPFIENENNVENASLKLFEKYGIEIIEDSMEILKTNNNYILIKATLKDMIVKNNFEFKILKDACDIIDNEIQKNIIIEIYNKIIFEIINDSFWLGIILTVEDSIKDLEMKNILTSFLLNYSSIFCQEIIKYKLGQIIDNRLSKTELNKMRNSYLKDVPLYDSNTQLKTIEEMGIDLNKCAVFDVVLKLVCNELIDVNIRNWKMNTSNKSEIYNGIILSARRWIKNQFPENISDSFEILRTEYVEEFIDRIKEITVISKPYSANKLFIDKSLTDNDKIYILQRIGLIKTIDLISSIFKETKNKVKKNEDGFFINSDIFFIKVKATIIEIIWNDSMNDKLEFLNNILNNLPSEIDSNFFHINRKCRDNIHYGFYNEITNDDYLMLEKNQDIYISYIIGEFDKKIMYVFDKKYERNIKIANFIYKISKK